ncbi:vascular endothelial zinc finger 1-like isoform X1 [Nerophis ophidion]|uniref:vascular endothelial zinc finger 1-like isoform X1 n=1 Tax=Nerophis ophidion TaxID=159077 RepID=UPI002AE05F3B|nr:vascular endothelial zinc finger 1-like isoform X1 [Nerophis ophidion]
MEPSWSTFLFQQANEALHHQHQVAQNSLLPLLNAGTEPIDQKPILPIQLEHKAPTNAADLLKDNVASGGGVRPLHGIKKEHKGKTPFVCGYCNKAFRDSYHLRRHESSHTGIKMVSRPKKTAQTAPTMVPMISTMTRDNNGNPSYISTAAGILSTATTSVSSGASIMTSSLMGNMQHQTLPKKPAKPVKKNHGCEMCGKAFRDVYHLNRHKLSHSDEKPFECPICHQRFKRKDRMTYHVRSHDGGIIKPYVCSVCGKGFSRPDHLSCHVKHVHSSERPFKCQVTACTSAFATKDRLRSHMIRHEGKVTCSICGKMLSAAYITSHLKTHGQTNFNSCNKVEGNMQFRSSDLPEAETQTARDVGGLHSPDVLRQRGLQLGIRYTRDHFSSHLFGDEPRQCQQPPRRHHSRADEHQHQHSQHHVTGQPPAPGHHHRARQHRLSQYSLLCAHEYRPLGRNNHPHGNEYCRPAQYCHETSRQHAFPVPSPAVFPALVKAKGAFNHKAKLSPALFFSYPTEPFSPLHQVSMDAVVQ